MSEDGDIELLLESFVAAASLAVTSSSFALVSLSFAVVSSSCLTTASNFRSNSAKRRSQRSQSRHPFPVLMDDDSIRHRRLREYQFPTCEQLPDAEPMSHREHLAGTSKQKEARLLWQLRFRQP